ncbi:MAG TPA: glycosyltransferase 87 family protein, partial [Ktedonobacteraceae bacterium]|nr:glycosyltransferase 87 family protein [Ktedonobacteraceae bacterium]
GFAAFKYNFYNYNPPYLYLLALATFLPIPKLVAVKSISVFFDVVLSIFTYLILDLRFKRSSIPAIGALVVLFVPTVFINSALWGQCDAIYTAFCLGSLYFVLKDRPLWACVFFGLAFAFKLQAIFFAPILLILLLRNKLPLHHLLLIPAIFLIMLMPALIAGRDMGSLLSIYVEQSSTGGVAGAVNGPGAGNFPPSNGANGPGSGNLPPLNGAGNPGSGNLPPTTGANGPGSGNLPPTTGVSGGALPGSALTYEAPTFYQWLPTNAPGYWKWVGILLAALLVALVSGLTWTSKKALTFEILVKAALVCALAIPFLLPEMHERYFYLADVLSITYAFCFRRRFYIAIIVPLCSLCSYLPYLLHRDVVNLAFVAVAVFVAAAIVLVDFLFTVYPDLYNRLNRSSGSKDEPPPLAITEAVSVEGSSSSTV